ncbi:MAG: Na/Pi cotransporter family protein [Candidatus Accumulibacter sp.]|jgi:phosphate:Na+ symporter|nr:Na/Pi cotransporter family protein [Accumulibacter sp.]
MSDSGAYELSMILGAAALLLWGVRMARTGVMRAYGAQIRRALPRALHKRSIALLTGAGAATVLQSSIAVAVFTSGLATAGAIPVADGLVLLLGADAGSAVVAALLTLNLKALWPILMFVGYLLHSIYSDTESQLKQFGRIFLGIAMILIALTFMGQVSAALAESSLIRTVVSSLGGELLIAVLLFAILTWVAHSSIAILLFWASLVQAGITTDAGLILAAVLGINIGNAGPPLLLTWNQAATARRIVIGNGLFKLAGVFVCFAGIRLIEGLYETLPGAPSFRVVILHILFNCALIVVFTPLTRWTTNILERLFVDPPKVADGIGPRYIPDKPGEAGEKTGLLPVTALSREVLRVLGTVQTMLEKTLDMLLSGNGDEAPEIARMEEKINVLYKAVRAYAVDLTRKSVDEQELQRITALLRYTASLENAGDVICKTMLGIPDDMKRAGKKFSEEGKKELDMLFHFLIGNTQLAAEVVMAWQPLTAGVLVQRKRDFKAMCQESSRQHIERLSHGVSNALESSSAHLDLISDMRWINTQVASIGYDALPASEDSGDGATERLISHPE